MLQSPPVKAVILDAQGLRRAWRRIAHEVIERQADLVRALNEHPARASLEEWLRERSAIAWERYFPAAER